MSDNILREVNPEWFTKVVDDILVFGKNKNEAYERFEKILKIFEKHGLIVSCEKLQEGNVIMWTGYKISIPEGGGPITISPSEEKIKAIRDYPTPKNRTKLRRFLGMCTQIQSWTPNLQINVTHMNQLTSKLNLFQSLETHD